MNLNTNFSIPVSYLRSISNVFNINNMFKSIKDIITFLDVYIKRNMYKLVDIFLSRAHICTFIYIPLNFITKLHTGLKMHTSKPKTSLF